MISMAGTAAYAGTHRVVNATFCQEEKVQPMEGLAT